MSSVTSQEEAPPLAVLAFNEAALLALTDPWQRSGLAHELERRLSALTAQVRAIRNAAIHELVRDLATPQVRVATHLGVSATRVGQIISPKKTRAAAQPGLVAVAA